MANFSRRELLRKSVYVAPVIVTLPAIPSFAQAGSGGALDCNDIVFDPQTGFPVPGQDPDLLNFCFPNS